MFSLPQEIACTCLFLAGKVEERRVRVDYVLGAYYADKEAEERKMALAGREEFHVRPRPVLDSAEWDALRTRVYEYEALLLDAIEYNFDILHPYSYLRKFLEKYIYSNVYCKESTNTHDTLRALSSLLFLLTDPPFLFACLQARSFWSDTSAALAVWRKRRGILLTTGACGLQRCNHTRAMRSTVRVDSALGSHSRDTSCVCDDARITDIKQHTQRTLHTLALLLAALPACFLVLLFPFPPLSACARLSACATLRR